MSQSKERSPVDRLAKRRGAPGCKVSLGPAWREGEDGPVRSTSEESGIPVTGIGFEAEGQRRLGVPG